MLKIFLAAHGGALYSVQAFINFSSVVNVLIYAVLGFVYGGLVLVLCV